jgi:Fur family transcriptional regulator, zinc uptake regulator
MTDHDHSNCGGPDAPDLAFARHDHGSCSAEGLARAEAMVAQKGLRMTPVAYEVLERLAAEGFGNQPPVAYRALEFLTEQGLAHRIQRLNAFTACMHTGEAHAPVFLICRDCNLVSEAASVPVQTALAEQAAEMGFVIERSTIEALGLCPQCQSAEVRA